MENDYKLSGLIDKNSLRAFFKEYVEDTRASIEKKTQEMLKLINSAKEENENFISKSK